MKQLIILFCLFNQLISLAQTDTVKFETLKLKKGIYFSFDEINNNTPSFTDSMRIKERREKEFEQTGRGAYYLEFPVI